MCYKEPWFGPIHQQWQPYEGGAFSSKKHSFFLLFAPIIIWNMLRLDQIRWFWQKNGIFCCFLLTPPKKIPYPFSPSPPKKKLMLLLPLFIRLVWTLMVFCFCFCFCFFFFGQCLFCVSNNVTVIQNPLHFEPNSYNHWSCVSRMSGSSQESRQVQFCPNRNILRHAR